VRPHRNARVFAVSLVVALGVCALAGCPGTDPDPPPDECAAGFLGDRNKEPVIELRAIGVDGTSAPIGDGDDVALILPPQGGRVSFIGIRATNLEACGLQLIGAIRDLSSRRVMVDGRTLNLNATGDGWGTTGTASTDLSDVASISNFANVPICPNQWADTDAFDQPFEIEVRLTDKSGRKATKTARVVPRCAEAKNRDECLCICKRGYVLGQVCAPSDAGSDAALPDASADAAADAPGDASAND
jgi:hypothetical protein